MANKNFLNQTTTCHSVARFVFFPTDFPSKKMSTQTKPAAPPTQQQPVQAKPTAPPQQAAPQQQVAAAAQGQQGAPQQADYWTKTKNSLQPLIKKPTLVDKYLQRPPFGFLQMIMAEVVKTNKLFEGLFTDEELTTDKPVLCRILLTYLGQGI